jgi:ABC-2 type transport system ATP-binding protein
MIEVIQLCKAFSGVPAVQNISFNVAKGEILGFLGPNGAGKSTTMRMITGFIPPSGGTVIVGGHPIDTQGVQARRKIGYLPENAPVYPDMTVRDYLDFIARIRGFKGAERKSRVADTMTRCFLEDVGYKIIHTLSKGYKQRVCFAQSILHDPEYLVLDEPTDGLDPNQKHEVRQMIQGMRASKAIILSTHILEEVEAVCTRAIIISRGRIVVDDTPDNLRTRSAVHGAVCLGLAPCDTREMRQVLQNLACVRDVELVAEDAKGVTLRVYPQAPGGSIADTLVAALRDRSCRITALFVEQGRLDDVFRSITKRAA